jgi:uncharacterized protein YuzE
LQNPDRLLDEQSKPVLAGTGRIRNMRMRYVPEADVLLLVLRNNPPVDAIEEPGGVIISYGEDGEPVSVEFLNASVRELTLPGEISVTIQAGKS